MIKDNPDFKWLVTNFDCNKQKIEKYNVLRYREEDIKKLKKKYSTKEEFEKEKDKILERIEELDKREALIAEREKELESEKDKLDQVRSGLELEKKKLEEHGFTRLPDWKDALGRYLKEIQ